MNKQNDGIFTKHVAARLEKAKTLGINATWRTEDHLSALAESIWIALDIAHGEQTDERFLGLILETLEECYNVSQYQQMLARRFKGTTHFQRAEKKSTAEALDDEIAKLVAQAKQ